jgi:hypothetical protein
MSIHCVFTHPSISLSWCGADMMAATHALAHVEGGEGAEEDVDKA